MPGNYFDAHHTQSDHLEFGLYDDPDPAKNPAYIMEEEPEKWIGIVHNPDQIIAHFYGIDNDVNVRVYKAPPNDNTWESNCEGMLHHRNNISFIELKEREGSGWLSKSTGQLINTIRLFAAQHSLDQFDDVNAFVCNSLRPRSNANHTNQMQRFMDETESLNFKGINTGLKMNVMREITI
ncbi:hypothetical protein [Mucilaginibacter sp.]